MSNSKPTALWKHLIDLIDFVTGTGQQWHEDKSMGLEPALPKIRLQSVPCQICDSVIALKGVICPKGAISWPFLTGRTLYFPLWEMPAPLPVGPGPHYVNTQGPARGQVDPCLLQPVGHQIWSCCTFSCDWSLVKAAAPAPEAEDLSCSFHLGVLTGWLVGAPHRDHWDGRYIAPAHKKIRL